MTLGIFLNIVYFQQSRPFDLTRLVLKWTEYIAKFWHRKIPSELLDIYLNIYPYYL